MRAFLLFALAGLIAQLVDGSLGMAYGVTSTSVLLAAGTAPAIASASVHLAEVGTTLASGASHWRFGNVDWRVVGILAVPGAVGAVLGAYVLVNMTEDAEPYMAGILLAARRLRAAALQLPRGREARRLRARGPAASSSARSA